MKTTLGGKLVNAAGIICILLTASLVGTIANYTSIINAKDNTITSQDVIINNLNSTINSQNLQITEDNNTISSLTAQVTSQDSQIQALTNQANQLNGTVTVLNAQIRDLQSQLASANSTINSLNSSITTLQSQVQDLTAIINMSKSKQLQTLAFHVSWGRIPNVSYTYNQILALNNNAYNILLLPEYAGNKNWTEELAWIVANFGGQNGIPIMLPVFGGGSGAAPDYQLNTTQIYAALANANVKWIAFGEIVSWYTEHPDLPFPTADITSILEFCRANSLRVFWTEWKVDAFKAIQTYIKGYEDIVTVSFSTNSGDVEPADGFLQVSNIFQKWGASVQAWYWTTRYSPDPLNMPISLLIQHALSAKNVGAEILEFEPYWYFFNNGQTNENLKLMLATLA